MPRGVVAAGHPRTAEAGAAALRGGGNAVDAALAAMLASYVAEPLLTSIGAGGYLLVVDPAGEASVLDFFVEMPGREVDLGSAATLLPVPVDFGGAEQVFNAGSASVGTYGAPAGICEAAERWCRLPLADLVEPAVGLARNGVEVNAIQAYVVALLAPVISQSRECLALFEVDGRLAREGDLLHNAELATTLERLAAEGAAPFYTGDIAAAVCAHLAEHGGLISPADLAAYAPVLRRPVRIGYRGRQVISNPPPSAGGVLIAYALAMLERGAEHPPGDDALIAVMAKAQAERTPAFMEGLGNPAFGDGFLASRLGATTHIAAIDEEGWAASVTASNGVGSGVVVAGTGIHLNNMLGEHDLNPLGFHHHPPGRRLPSMMAPTAVLSADGRAELVLGSAGSNRIRSAILQVVCNVVDRGMDIEASVGAPRVHFEDGTVYAEPGAHPAGRQDGFELSRFDRLNLFFGGVQAARRDPAGGELSGAGDPRRGGTVAYA